MPFPGFKAFLALLVALASPGAARPNDPPAQPETHQELVDALKKHEERVGFGGAGNFSHADPRVPAYYRCYFTRVLELPGSYDGLRLRKGTETGCSVDTRKYDLFFYRIEAVASGKAPITDALRSASADRVAMVVPHEDFHAEVENLPEPIAEAASTLVGFLTGAAVTGQARDGQPGDAELFLAKAEMINRYHARLGALYRDVRRRAVSKESAVEQKRLLFDALGGECGGITPEPRSFNKCPAAMNNAGLAFDHTYTLYYPLLYRVYVACGRDLKSTVAAIRNAPAKRGEAEVVRYFSEIARAVR